MSEAEATAAPRDDVARFPRLRRRRRGRWRRRAAWAAAALLALLVVCLVIAGVQGLRARGDLLEARAALTSAVPELTGGDTEAALARFAEARAAAEAGEAKLANPAVTVAGWVPGARPTVGQTRAVAAGAAEVGRAGEELAGAALTLPDGVGALAPRDGRIPVDRIREVAPALAAAHERVAAAGERLEEAPAGWAPATVREGYAELSREIDQVAPMLADAAVAAEVLPPFLGADGPRRYLVGAQNPAEVRGAGGFMGAWSVLTADDGELDFASFRSVIALTTLPRDDVPAPSEEYEARYSRYGGANFAQNANMTPDAPSAAQALEALYAAAEGERLDGTVLVDPFALEAMVEVTGAVEVPDVGEVAADDLVAVVANEAYAEMPDSPERKEVLGDVAAEVLDEFLDGGDPLGAAEALADAAGGGHLLLHAADARVQAGLDELGVTGRVDAEGATASLAVVANSGSQNKTDFYVQREVDHRLELRPDGSGRLETEVTLTNDSPTSGQPVDVIGPNLPTLEPGENRTYLSVFCAHGCAFAETALDGEEHEPLRVEPELGHDVASTWLRVSPEGGQRTLTHRIDVAEAWDPAEGRVALRLHDQPTIRPDEVTVTVLAPDGLRLAASSPDVRVDGDEAVLRGELDRRTDVELTVVEPSVTPLRRFIDWLGEPVFAGR